MTNVTFLTLSITLNVAVILAIVAFIHGLYR